MVKNTLPNKNASAETVQTHSDGPGFATPGSGPSTATPHTYPLAPRLNRAERRLMKKRKSKH